MLRLPKQVILAECADLLLAQACVADLSNSDFEGKIDVIRAAGWSNSETIASSPFGTPAGAATTRGIAVGGVIGFVISIAMLSLAPTAMQSFAVITSVVAASVLLGSLCGAHQAFKRFQDTAGTADDTNVFWVRCEGSQSELDKAFEVLLSSACSDVFFSDDEESVFQELAVVPRNTSDHASAV
jgi:hypothetical protein